MTCTQLVDLHMRVDTGRGCEPEMRPSPLALLESDMVIKVWWMRVDRLGGLL
jgi:hypothetical protein